MSRVRCGPVPIHAPTPLLCRILCELTAQHCKNFAECLLDVIFPKPNLLDTLDVGELISSVFQQDDCPIESKASLKQSRFVDHVLPSSEVSLGRFVFSCHN